MTPPIRMVSVPVDLAETPAIRNSLGLFRSAILCGEQWSDTCRDAYVAALNELDKLAMLTAAPVREEGGAVDDAVKIATDLHHAYEQLIYGLPKYLEAENLTDEENMIREAWITLDVTAHRLAALATREEAPAEAGELQGAIAFMEGAAVMLGRGEMPAPGSQYAAAWWKAHAAVLSALRAQPQAREEAQPVAKPAPFNPGGIGHAMYQAFNVYLADYVLSTDGADYEPTPFERNLIEDFFAGLMAEEAFFGPVRALYDTHPDPDALRAAVEALEALAGEEGDCGEKVHVPCTWKPFREVARQALATLAALQQEGR